MKKLLVLMLVVGKASLANAMLEIAVNGNPEPEDSTIILAPREIAILDIYSDIDISAGDEGEGCWVLYYKVACASISGGVVAPSDTDWSIDIWDDAVGFGIPLPEGYNGAWGAIFTSGKPIPAGVIYDEINFHFESAAPECMDVIVTLQEVTAYWEPGQIWDTVIIHQIPEPATILLLGVGAVMMNWSLVARDP